MEKVKFITEVLLGCGILLVTWYQLDEARVACQDSAPMSFVQILHESSECSDDASKWCPLDEPSCDKAQFGECPPKAHLAVRQMAAEALVSTSREVVSSTHAWTRGLLQHSRIPWSNFDGANLSLMKFYAVDLRCSQFARSTKMKDAVFEFVDLRGAFAVESGLAEAPLTNALCPDGTFVPKGTCKDRLDGEAWRKANPGGCNWHVDPLTLPTKDGSLARDALAKAKNP